MTDEENSATLVTESTQGLADSRHAERVASLQAEVAALKDELEISKLEAQVSRLKKLKGDIENTPKVEQPKVEQSIAEQYKAEKYMADRAKDEQYRARLARDEQYRTEQHAEQSRAEPYVQEDPGATPAAYATGNQDNFNLAREAKLSAFAARKPLPVWKNKESLLHDTKIMAREIAAEYLNNNKQ